LGVRPQPSRPLSPAPQTQRAPPTSEDLSQPEPRRLRLQVRPPANPGRWLRIKRRPGAASEARAGLAEPPKAPAALGDGARDCGCARPGPARRERITLRVPLAHCRLPGAHSDKGGGGPGGPQSHAPRPARRRTRPLPEHHSALRADTALGVAEPSRRAASAPDSPWSRCPESGEARLAAPRCLSNAQLEVVERRPQTPAFRSPQPDCL
jgi:hypothetical protein